MDLHLSNHSYFDRIHPGDCKGSLSTAKWDLSNTTLDRSQSAQKIIPAGILIPSKESVWSKGWPAAPQGKGEWIQSSWAHEFPAFPTWQWIMTCVTLDLPSLLSPLSSPVLTERTKSPGWLWLSRTRKLPCFPFSVKSFSASLPERCPWNHLEVKGHRGRHFSWIHLFRVFIIKFNLSVFTQQRPGLGKTSVGKNNK